ncbi:Dopamine receptor 1 [Polyplax serrata]|uniref:Dopamine receptor 1 n=1 Tax=Polyplax serrata TaxID=468196 RepID=A0AAN8S9P0_POLSC
MATYNGTMFNFDGNTTAPVSLIAMTTGTATSTPVTAMTTTSKPPFEPGELTPLRIFLVGVIPSFLIFMSIAGNILVVVAIYTDRGLRRIGNLFLASLAIADLFVASLVMTFAVANDLLKYWVFGSQFCDTWIAFDVMCSTASILNLCVISLDRYIHIKDPLRYGRWVTRRVALGSIAAIWILAALISFLPISLGIHTSQDPWEYTETGIRYYTCAMDLLPIYAVLSSCISFYIPTLVMLGIYLRLYMYAQKHVKSIRAVTKPFDNSNYSSDQPHAIAAKLNAQNSSAYHVSDHKAAITVGIIMGVFLVCWVPFFCVNIVAAFCKPCIPPDVFKVLTWLGYSNSAFNPVIYSIFNTEFREAFKKILTTNYAGSCWDSRRSEFNYRSRKSLEDYIGRRNSSEKSKRNGSCSQIKDCSSSGSLRQGEAADVGPTTAFDGSQIGQGGCWIISVVVARPQKGGCLQKVKPNC